jgi:hypothetical protein
MGARQGIRGGAPPALPPDHGGPRWSRLLHYWAEVSDDSHRPIEWRRPVPDDQAHALAVKVPELALRTANAIAAGAGRI